VPGVLVVSSVSAIFAAARMMIVRIAFVIAMRRLGAVVMRGVPHMFVVVVHVVAVPLWFACRSSHWGAAPRS